MFCKLLHSLHRPFALAAGTWLASALLLAPAASYASIAEGREALEAGKVEDASAWFKAAKTNGEDIALASRWLGISYFQQGRFKEAIQELEAAVNLAGGDAENHYALGVVQLARAQTLSALRARGPVKRAIRHFDQALALQNEHLGARFYLIQVLINAPGIAGGDLERARSLNTYFIEQSPHHARVIEAVLARKLDEPERAQSLLQDVLAQATEFSPALYQLCDLSVARQEFIKARDYCEEFLQQPQPWDGNDQTTARFLLGRALAGSGDSAAAHQAFQKVLQDSNNPRLVKQTERALRGEIQALEEEADAEAMEQDVYDSEESSDADQ